MTARPRRAPTRKPAKRRRAAFTVVDLFCGAGGTTRGFHDAGFQTVAAVENFRPVAEAFLTNFPKVELVCDDLKRVDVGRLPKADVVVASPPCEPFTPANADRYRDPLDRLYKDPIGGLTFHCIRALKVLQPRVFVVENVPGVVEGALRSELRKLLRAAGYPRVEVNLLRAEDHGVASRRTRVFLSNVKLEPPRVAREASVWDSIADLESLDVAIPNHEEYTTSRRERGRIADLGSGQSIHHYRSAIGKLHGFKTRIRHDAPAPTVMGSSRFIHPFQDRFLTVREHARLMSFPDEHVFVGGRNVQYDEVGEAVPPLLARRIADEVRKALEADA